jgi:hypothetical protein
MLATFGFASGFPAGPTAFERVGSFRDESWARIWGDLRAVAVSPMISKSRGATVDKKEPFIIF